MRVAISDFRALLYVRCFWVRMVRATLFCLASTLNWKPETGLAVVVDAKAALEPVRWFWREKRACRRCQRRNRAQSTRHITLKKEREKDKGRRDATEAALGNARTFFGNLSRSSPRDAIGGRTHSRARAKQSFERVRVSSFPPLFPRAPRFKEAPAFFSSPIKNLFLLRRIFARKKQEKRALKDAFRASGAWERGAAREQKKGEEEEGSNAPVLDRLERKNGAVVGMVADMFFSSFGFAFRVCARRCFVSVFLSKEKEKEKTKKWFRVSSIFTP